MNSHQANKFSSFFRPPQPSGFKSPQARLYSSQMFALMNVDECSMMIYLLWFTVCYICWGQVKSFSTQIVWKRFNGQWFLFTERIKLQWVYKKKENTLKMQFSLPSLESESSRLQSSIRAGHCSERLGQLIRNSGWRISVCFHQISLSLL